MGDLVLIFQALWGKISEEWDKTKTNIIRLIIGLIFGPLFIILIGLLASAKGVIFAGIFISMITLLILSFWPEHLLVVFIAVVLKKTREAAEIYLRNIISGIMIWEFIVLNYVIIVPVFNLPGVVFLVLVSAIILGLSSAAWRFPLENARRIIYRLALWEFLIATAYLFFPKFFQVISKGLQEIGKVVMGVASGDLFRGTIQGVDWPSLLGTVFTIFVVWVIGGLFISKKVKTEGEQERMSTNWSRLFLASVAFYGLVFGGLYIFLPGFQEYTQTHPLFLGFFALVVFLAAISRRGLSIVAHLAAIFTLMMLTGMPEKLGYKPPKVEKALMSIHHSIPIHRILTPAQRPQSSPQLPSSKPVQEMVLYQSCRLEGGTFFPDAMYSTGITVQPDDFYRAWIKGKGLLVREVGGNFAPVPNQNWREVSFGGELSFGFVGEGPVIIFYQIKRRKT